MNQSRKKQSNPGKSTSDSGISQDLFHKAMPESLEAEAAVLGSMILDNQCIGEVVQLLKSEAFYRLEHQIIFDALTSLFESGNGIDLVLLRDKIKQLGKLDDIGGITYLTKIVDSVPTTANVIYYADVVKENFMMRQLISAATGILNNAYETGGDVKTKLDEAERKIFEVTEQKITGQTANLRDLIHQAIENIENPVKGLSTGYEELDEMLCGLHDGDMIIIAGRPSMGKTSFAMNIAEYIAADDNKPVVIFSLEMGQHQLAQRILCSRAKVNLQSIRHGNLEEGAYEELVRTGSELSEKPLYIDDTSALTPLELKAKARRLKSRYGISCIVIDYLQLMSVGGRADSRQQEITTISRHLKALARELSVPVIVLSQLNRAAEGREGHRPRMSDLRESGSIEQDADVVILLHREDYYHRGEPDYADNKQAEVIVAKQRNGPTGTVKLTFLEQFTRFETLTFMPEPF